jgi:hypothetical protein
MGVAIITMRRLVIVAAVLAVAVAGCAKTYPLRTADRNPAAVGTITAGEDQNKNTTLEVRVEHLAPPPSLESTLSTYVVWVRPNASQEFTNVGQLAMQNDRSGLLKATTPFPEFEVLVTAEQSGTAKVPSPFVVLEGHARRR